MHKKMRKERKKTRGSEKDVKKMFGLFFIFSVQIKISYVPFVLETIAD